MMEFIADFCIILAALLMILNLWIMNRRLTQVALLTLDVWSYIECQSAIPAKKMS